MSYYRVEANPSYIVGRSLGRWRSSNLPTWQNVYDVPEGVYLVPNLPRTRSGSAVAGFKSLIMERKNASSTYSCSGWKGPSEGIIPIRYFSRYALHDYWEEQELVKYPQLSQYSFPLESSPLPLQSLLYEKFYRVTSQRVPQVQTMVELAQLGKTKRLIRDTATDLAHLVFGDVSKIKKDIDRHRRGYSKTRKAKYFAGRFLEAQYGWRPLINTIDSAFQVISNTWEQCLTRVTVDVKDEWVSTAVLPQYLLGFEWDEIYSYRNSELRKMTIGFIPDNPISSGLNINSSGLAMTVWDLIPYSFVADWFFDVSTWLYAQQVGGWNFIYGSESRRRGSDRSIMFKPRVHPAGSLISIPLPVQHQAWDYSRSRLDSFPNYLPPVKFMEGLTTSRLLSTAALLTNLLHGVETAYFERQSK